MQKVAITPITGLPLAHSWAQIISNQSQSLICALGVKGPNAKNFGREIYTVIQKRKIASAADIHNLFLDALSQARTSQHQLQFAAIWLSQKQHMVAAAYRGSIMLARITGQQQVKTGTVLKAGSELRIIQGQTHKHDQLALITKAAEQFEAGIHKYLTQQEKDQALSKKLEEKLHATERDAFREKYAVAACALINLNPSPLTVEENEETIGNQKQLSSAQQKKPQQAAAGSKQRLIHTKSRQESTHAGSKQRLIHTKSRQESTHAGSKQTPVHKEVEKKSIKHGETQKQSIPHKKDLTIKISFGSLLTFAKSVGGKLTSLAKQGVAAIVNLLNSLKKGRSLESNKQNKPKISISHKGQLLFSSFKQALRQLRPGQEIYLQQSKAKKAARIVGGMLFVILLISGVWLWRRNWTKQQTIKINQELKPATTLFNQAQSSADNDIVQARDQASNALEILTAKSKEHQSNRFAQNIINHKIEEVKQFFQQISGEIEVSQLDVYFDLRQVVPNFLTSHLTLSQDNLLFFDQEKGQLISLGLDTQNNQKLVNSELIGARDIVAGQGQLFILHNGVQQINLPLSENQIISIKQEGDSDREGKFIDFFQGYLYVFNPEQRNIFRYVNRDQELSDPAGWLQDKKNIEFSTTSSMVIDGQIWLSDPNGQILRYERGNAVEFNVSGVEPSFSNNIQLYTNQNLEVIYVLEPERQRLVTLTKEGEFINQISSPSLASATDFVVIEQQAYVVSGSIVYSVSTTK